MSNELQTKLDAILLDKNTNLLPEHLKAGVTCLGVNGTLQEGAITEVEYDECLVLSNKILTGLSVKKVTDGLLYSLDTYEVFSNKYIDTGISQSSIKSAYTIVISMNPNSWSNYKGVIGLHGGNHQGIVGFQYQNGKLNYTNKPDSGKDILITPFTTNTDHTIIITYGNSLINIYDGDTRVVSDVTNVDINPLGNVIIGRAFNGSDRYFDGKLGYCYIYNRVLTEAEMNQMKLYSATIRGVI